MSTAQRRAVAVLLVVALAACQAERRPEAAPHETFWASLQGLCGQAFAGRPVEAPAGDSTFATAALVMHVRTCTADEIRIPFHVGGDRSRTWVLTRTASGIRLKHDHRHEDGLEDSVSQYGGDSDGWDGYLARNSEEVRAEVGSPSPGGTATRQEFPADEHTATLIPAAVSNIWTIEVEPGRQFAYALRRLGTDRRFRIEFDLSAPVEVPPAPWGSVDP